MKADIRDYYMKCLECLEFKRSKAQASTEISYENLFMSFEPGQQVQCDFCEYSGHDYMLIAYEISGFFKVTKTKKQFYDRGYQSFTKIRSRFWFTIQGENGFKSQCKDLGVEVMHSNCYNAPSQRLIERKIAVLKDLLKKSRNFK